MTKPRIVFFGTPDFAVPSLESLLSSGFHIAAVVTAPDKPAGRGLKAHESPVKLCAAGHGIPVLQPVNLKDPQFLQLLDYYRPDLQIVIAFRMLPRQVWSLPAMGTFNLHASLLPEYRGAAPINWAIINGEKETGLTTFFINDKIDTGGILLSDRMAIGQEETAGQLHDRLMNTGAKLVVSTVERIVSGKIEEIKQDMLIRNPDELKNAPKIFREDCRINWNREVRKIHDFIRGLSPHPGAFTEMVFMDGSVRQLKIFRAGHEEIIHSQPPGNFFTDRRSFLKVSAKNGFIHIGELQIPGRKVLNTVEFLRGFGRIIPETHGI